MESIQGTAAKMKQLADELCSKARETPRRGGSGGGGGGAGPSAAADASRRELEMVIAKYDQVIPEWCGMIDQLQQEKADLRKELDAVLRDNAGLRQQLTLAAESNSPLIDANLAELQARLQEERRNRLQTEEQYSSIITQQEENQRRLEAKLAEANQLIATLEGGDEGAAASALASSSAPTSAPAATTPQSYRYRMRSPKSGGASQAAARGSALRAAAAAASVAAAPAPAPPSLHETPLHYATFVDGGAAAPAAVQQGASAVPLHTHGAQYQQQQQQQQPPGGVASTPTLQYPSRSVSAMPDRHHPPRSSSNTSSVFDSPLAGVGPTRVTQVGGIGTGVGVGVGRGPSPGASVGGSSVQPLGTFGAPLRKPSVSAGQPIPLADTGSARPHLSARTAEADQQVNSFLGYMERALDSMNQQEASRADFLGGGRTASSSLNSTTSAQRASGSHLGGYQGTPANLRRPE